MNPLTVTDQLGEGVNELLRHLLPVADANLLSDEPPQLFNFLDHPSLHANLGLSACCDAHCPVDSGVAPGRASNRALRPFFSLFGASEDSAWGLRPVTPGFCWHFSRCSTS